MNEEKDFTEHDDMPVPKGELISVFDSGEKAVDIYYVWCADEKKRIGGYSGNLTVINNRATHHSREKGHNTYVYRK